MLPINKHTLYTYKLPMPKSLLYLAFVCFGFITCTQTPPKNTTVGVVCLGSVSPPIKDSVVQALEHTYGFRVVLMGTQNIPQRFYTTTKTPRYRADSIIRYLKETKPDSIDYVVGLTAFDISTTKRDSEGNILKPESKYTDWGVFGLGYVNGPSCIVSNYRLKTTDKAVFYSRIQKVAIHELGHNLGLPHCKNKHCVMADAVEKISTIDTEGMALCSDCKKAIE